MRTIVRDSVAAALARRVSRSARGKPDIERAWRASHEAIAAGGPDRRLVVADRSRHLIAKERPETIVEGVVSLLSESRRSLP